MKAVGHIIVYCDKVADSLHTQFRLESAKGGEVYLFRNGQLIDQVTGLKKQPAPNIAYGRKTDGSDEWGYQLTATPKEPNCGDICDHDHILGEPVFSEEGRVQTSAGSISLKLSIPDDSPEGTEIRYTTDGTEPDAASQMWTKPVAVAKAKVIKAKAYYLGLESKTTYLFVK